MVSSKHVNLDSGQAEKALEKWVNGAAKANKLSSEETEKLMASSKEMFKKVSGGFNVKKLAD